MPPVYPAAGARSPRATCARHGLASLVAALAVTLGCAGCTVIEAPDTIEELVVFGFEHFDDDEGYLEAMGRNLFPLLEEHDEVLADSGWHVDRLADEHLLAAGVEADDVVSIVGALGLSEYRHPLRDVVCMVSYPEKDEIYEHYKHYEAVDTGDRECFLDGACDLYVQDVEQTVEIAVLGDATQTLTRAYRWVRPRGGEPYMVGRSLSPYPVEFTTSILAVDQQYALFVIAPRDDGVVRYEAFWAESRFLGLEVSEYFMVETAVGEMQNQAAAINEYLDEYGGC